MEQLHKRYEFKYIIDANMVSTVRSVLLKHGMQPDPYAKDLPNRSYPVTSLYFDSPSMSDYQDKAGGFLVRKKIRVRIYEPNLTDKTPLILLEKKSKHEMLISKKRISITHNEYENLIRGSSVDIIKNHTEFLPLAWQSMRPVAAVFYMREPLVYPHQQGLRVTFDSSLEACKSRDLRELCFSHRVTDGEVIMEIKFSTALPFWFRKVIREFHIRRTAFSKYGKSIERVYQYHPIPR
jgi:SPX domain protein involved in polyphosphate accumulation